MKESGRSETGTGFFYVYDENAYVDAWHDDAGIRLRITALFYDTDSCEQKRNLVDIKIYQDYKGGPVMRQPLFLFVLLFSSLCIEREEE